MVVNVKISFGTGGMLSKIKAAQKVSVGGGSSFIGPGKEENILQKLFSGEMIGTFFLPSKDKMQSRKRWIAQVLKAKGTIIIDDGAKDALVKRGRSLLPSGINAIEGSFGVGDAVYCVDTNGDKLAVGLVNYNSNDIEKIHGQHTDKIESILGFKDSEEVMHRDNLVLL